MPHVQKRKVMISLLVVLKAIATIFFVVGVGVLVGRAKWCPSNLPLAELALTVFLPPLSFVAISNVKPSMDLAAIAAFPWVIGLVQLGISWFISRQLPSLDKATQGAFILSVIAVNSGNFGISFSKAVFGQGSPEIEDMVVAMATVYYVSWCIFIQTVGVFAASVVADEGKHPLKESSKKVATMPLIYLSLAGLAVNYWKVPIASYAFLDPILQGVKMLAVAAVPLMLVSLGIRLSGVRWNYRDTVPLVFAAGQKLLVAPILSVIISFIFAMVFGMEILAQNIAITASSGPTAVQAFALAKKCGASEDFVKCDVLVTTLLILITLPVLVVLLTHPNGLQHSGLLAFLAR